MEKGKKKVILEVAWTLKAIFSLATLHSQSHARYNHHKNLRILFPKMNWKRKKKRARKKEKKIVQAALSNKVKVK